MTSGAPLRRLGTADAVVLGLSAMLGTGVFAVWAPAAAAAGPWLLLSVLLAGVVAACNAASSADLAVAHPESGGGYVYGYERLGAAAGRLGGGAFPVGEVFSAGGGGAGRPPAGWPGSRSRWGRSPRRRPRPGCSAATCCRRPRWWRRSRRSWWS